MEDELLATLAELEAEVDEPEPEPEPEEPRAVTKSRDELLAEMDELAPPPPAIPVEPAGELTSGTLVLKYSRSFVRRDDFGRIVEIIGEGTRKMVRRDEQGRITEIIEEEESEE